MTRVAAATNSKWVAIETFSATISVENPTPTIPPVLHRPWNDPLIFRSNNFCKAIACVFIEMLSTRMLKENRQSEAMRAKFVVAKPIDKMASDSATKANDMGIRLSYRATSQPEIGSPINELIGINKRMVPSSASL